MSRRSSTSYWQFARGYGSKRSPILSSRWPPPKWRQHQKASSQMNITDKDLVITLKDGNGKAFKYEVLYSPDADTLTLKRSDGEVTTFHRAGERFWITSTGTVNIRAYFLRAK